LDFQFVLDFDIRISDLFRYERIIKHEEMGAKDYRFSLQLVQL